MGRFKVNILKGGDQIEVGEFSYDDTVLTVKQVYYEKIDNSVAVNQLRFQYESSEMNNNKKLRYYEDDVGRFGMVIQLLGRLIGGSKNYMVYHGRKYHCGQTLEVWDPKLKTPKYNPAIITDITNASIGIHWKGYERKWDERIFKNDFGERLKDFRKDDDSKMDDIKEDNNNPNINDVNQDTGSNRGANNEACTGINVRKIRDIPFKIGEEVQFYRPAMMGGSSWEYGIITGFMNNNSGLIITYKSWPKNEEHKIHQKDFASKIKMTNEWENIRNVPFKIGETLSVYDDYWKKFGRAKIVEFAKDVNSDKKGFRIEWVGYENFAKITIWEDTFDFYVENMRNKGNNNTMTNIPTDVISIQPIGLSNLGNTCYFNSALQCLMSITQLNKYIINLNKYPKYGIISSLKKLYKQGNGNSVRNIMNQCSKLDSNIGSRGQYDSVVAFNIMRQSMDKELMNDNFKMVSKIKKTEIRNNPDDEDKSLSITDELYDKLVLQSKIRELMYGIQVRKYICLKCNSNLNLYKAFGSIGLPLKSVNIEIDVYLIISRNNKDEWLKCVEPETMKIRGKYKIRNLKENILVKKNINNDNNKYNVSIYSLNLSDKVNKWITYYNDDDYCERFNSENIVFAQIGIKNDKRIDVKRVDIFYDTKKNKIIKNDVNNNVEFSVLKRNKNHKSIQGKTLYDNFGKKHSKYKLYIFHNNKFVLNESSVKVTSKSVLIFIWLNNIDASAINVSLNEIVGSDNLKDIQDAKLAASQCINSKYPIIRDNSKTKNLIKGCQEIDKILEAYKFGDNVIKLCKNIQKIKFNKVKANNVEDCLRIYEEIIPDNGLACDVCDKTSLTMTKQVCVTKPPKVLLLEIDRDADDETNNRGHGRGYRGYNSYGKAFNDVNIEYPINGLKFKDSIYNLFAISDHSGYSTTFGHYVSYVRREVNGNTLWYNCNDSSISKIHNPMNKLQSNTAKLLLYIKKD